MQPEPFLALNRPAPRRQVRRVVVVDKVFADKASVVVKKVNGKPFKKGEIKQGDRVANVL
jgi:hypothetical protein